MISKKKIRLKITLKSISKELLFIYLLFIKRNFSLLKLKYKIFTFPKKVKRITLLKSPHINKKAKEQFELKMNKIVLYTIHLDTRHLKFLIFNKPKVINLKINLIEK